MDLYNSLNSSFDDIITYNSEGSDDAAEESSFLYSTAVRIMMTVIIVIILVGVFFSFVIIRSIKIPNRLNHLLHFFVAHVHFRADTSRCRLCQLRIFCVLVHLAGNFVYGRNKFLHGGS